MNVNDYLRCPWRLRFPPDLSALADPAARTSLPLLLVQVVPHRPFDTDSNRYFLQFLKPSEKYLRAFRLPPEDQEDRGYPAHPSNPAAPRVQAVRLVLLRPLSLSVLALLVLRPVPWVLGTNFRMSLSSCHYYLLLHKGTFRPDVSDLALQAGRSRQSLRPRSTRRSRHSRRTVFSFQSLPADLSRGASFARWPDRSRLASNALSSRRPCRTLENYSLAGKLRTLNELWEADWNAHHFSF